MLWTFELDVPSPLIIKSRYEVKSVLGRGGMGVVYQAFDGLIKRDVAVKTLREVPDGILVELFYRECSVLAGMVHPNVIEIFDMGEFEDDEGIARPYFVMPLLRGRTLHDLIYPATTPLSATRCVDVISQACRGLQAAHDRDLLHRDIKPRNIFVMGDDAVKLIDFGVAHLMGSNSTGIRGTPQYMSPEQITFKPLQRQSDIFSMATVCYEALTAVHPFLRNPEGRDSGSDIAGAITSYTPPLASDLNPAVSRAIAQAVAKGMAKDPWNRFESAAAFADALQKALRNEGMVRLNTAGVQIRIDRARRSLEQKDFQFASEIISELESEGHSDPEIGRIHSELDEAIRKDRADRLIEAARRYFASEEFTLALRKVQEILQIDAGNQTALELKKKIENVLTEQRVSDLLKTALECIERSAFTSARQAVQDVLKLRPNDPRARQLLNQIDSKQKELLKHRQDQERLFQAAHSAWLAGKIKPALANLEELTQATQFVHEPSERMGEYQDFYRRIRAEQAAIDGALEQGRKLLAGNDFSGAQRICERYLRKYPDHEDFTALAREVERLREEEAAAYRESIQGRLAAEGNLETQVEILEKALHTRPNEEYFRSELAKVKERQNEVTAVVNRARGFEKQRSFEQAIGEWSKLRQLYPQFPNLEDQLAKARDAFDKQRAQARDQWIARITKALDDSDHMAALRLLSEAAREFPSGHQLGDLAARARAQAERDAKVNSLLEQARTSAASRQFPAAQQALKEATAVSRGEPRLSKMVSGALLELGTKALDADWRAAKSMLDKVSQVDPALRVPGKVWEEIERCERDENVEKVLATAAAEQDAGRLKEAIDVLESAIRSYPGQQRLESRLQDLEKFRADKLRREEREADLKSLRALEAELVSIQTEPDLRDLLQSARFIAGQYPGDADFAPVLKQISEQADAFNEAAAALARDDIKQCLEICEGVLARVPEHRLFLGLKIQAEVRDRQKAAEFLESVERRLAAEPDLNQCAQILDDAVRRYPEEAFYQEELRLVRGKQDLVKAIAHRAQILEDNGWYAEALERWHYLQTIHPLQQGLDEAIARCSRLLRDKRERGRQQQLAAIRDALARHDYTAALDALAKAQVEFPDDAELQEVGHVARQARDRRTRADYLLNQGLEYLQSGHFEEGQRALGEAVNIDLEDATIRRSAASYLLEFALEALAVDLNRAESMVADACSRDPALPIPDILRDALEEARRRRDFDQCLAGASAFESAGEFEQAVETVDDFLDKYPGDPDGERLKTRLIETRNQVKKNEQRAKDRQELQALQDQAMTIAEPSTLLDLLKRTEQIAERNETDESLTVAAGELGVVLSALANIRRLISEERFREAEDLCRTSIDRDPQYTVFADLQSEIQSRQHEIAAEHLRQVEERLAKEPDFRKRANILEQAREAFPDESYYADELQLVLKKQEFLDAEIARTKEFESKELYEDALREWQALRSIYPWVARFDSDIARVSGLLQKKKDEIASAWLMRVRAATAKGDYKAAAADLETALAELPGETRLLALKQELAELQRRQSEAKGLLSRGQELLEQGEREEAIALFDKVLALVPESASVRDAIVEALLVRSEAIANEQWQEAETLVETIRRYRPDYQFPSGLLNTIRQGRRAAELGRVLADADLKIRAENWYEARGVLESAKNVFPGEQAIGERLDVVLAAIRELEAQKAKAAALGAISEFRTRLNATAKKRPLRLLQSAFESSSFLALADPEIRDEAERLRIELWAKIDALQPPPPQERKPMRARGAAFKSPRTLLPIGLLAALAAIAFWWTRTPPLQRIDFKVAPERVSVSVDKYSCVTPDCRIDLPPGNYQVQLRKDGFVPMTVPLTVSANAAVPPITASLTPLRPAFQIAANLDRADVSLDGRSLGTAAAGQFTIPTVAEGPHVIAVSANSGKASIPVHSDEKRALNVRGPITSDGISVLLVADEGESDRLISSLGSSQPVYVDGQLAGSTKKDGSVPLPKLKEGARQIRVGEAGQSLKFSLPAGTRPYLYAFITGGDETGALTVSSNVGDANLFVDGKLYKGAGSNGKFRLILPARSYELRAERSGYLASKPIRVSVEKGSDTAVNLRLTPKLAVVEVRGTAPGTTLKIDGVPRTGSQGNRAFRVELQSGSHSFELSRQGFVPKSFRRNVEPGETAVIQGADVAMTAAIEDTESQDWARASASGTQSDLEAFVSKYPSSPHASAAAQKIQQLEWDAVDKQSLSAVQAYLKTHPQGPHTAQARELSDALERAAGQHQEQTEWNAVDKTSRKALDDFVARHPDSSHATAAAALIAELKRKEELAQAEQAETTAWSGVNQRDRRALEGFIKQYPSGRFRSQADRILAGLTAPVTPPPESPAVLAAVQRLANAWNAKDLQAVVDAQPSLNKHYIKSQLDATRSIRVTITPVSDPKIDGDRATVVCRRLVEQVFSDGTRKTPASTVTYTLVRGTGGWIIENAR
jgi:serine/threonine protein kinase/outer membrane protein assembly factor BamD (BamD/ComL family)